MVVVGWGKDWEGGVGAGFGWGRSRSGLRLGVALDRCGMENCEGIY